MILAGRNPDEAALAVMAGESTHYQGFKPWSTTNIFTPQFKLPFDPAVAGKTRATGGRIGGKGLNDTVPMGGAMTAPGELVVNRHTERRVNAKLGNTTLGAMVSGENKPHKSRFATGGRFAKGGRVDTSNVHLDGHPSNITPSMAAGLAIVEKQFPGLTVGATTDGNHVRNSLHWQGNAVDLDGPYSLLQRAGTWITRHIGSRIAMGIHNDTLSIANGAAVPSSYWGYDDHGNSIWKGHKDHIHLGNMIGASSGWISKSAADKVKSIGRAASPAPSGLDAAAAATGIPSAVADQFAIVDSLTGIPGFTTAPSIRTKAAGGKSGGKAGGGGGGADAPVRGGAGGASGFALKLARQVGLFPAVVAAWVQAEGGPADNPLNIGPGGHFPDPIGATARFMTTADKAGFYKGILSAKTPADEIRAIIASPWDLGHYKNGVLNRTAAAHGIDLRLATGGRMPKFAGWHAAGMSGTFSTPTLIGVGERGSEKVSVTPTGKSGSGKVTINTTFNINGGEAGNVQREVEAALLSLISHIENNDVAA